MIALVILAVAAGTPPSGDDARFAACVAQSASDPAAAIAQAGDWRLKGGGVSARQCEGLAYARQARWAAAATAFENAARESEAKADPRTANLWVQAGNAALAGGDATKARGDLDSAIARGQLQGEELGEAMLDRGRARAALGDGKGAREDHDAALRLVPADPLGWLLSATLARKAGDLAKAQTDIGQALVLASDDASVALEAGNIAVLSGRDDAARTAWQAAIRNAPNSPQAKAAQDSLSRLGPGKL